MFLESSGRSWESAPAPPAGCKYTYRQVEEEDVGGVPQGGAGSQHQHHQQAANILTARLRRRMLVVSLREELGASTSNTSRLLIYLPPG